MLDFDKPLQTRDGREVRIYSREGNTNGYIHGAVREQHGWSQYAWTREGSGSYNVAWMDLVNVPPKPLEFKQWACLVRVPSGDRTIVVLRNGPPTLPDRNLLGWKEITISITEGEGL